MSIRRANFEDFNEVSSLYSMVHNLHFENRCDIYEEGKALSILEFKSALEDENSTTLVYEVNNEILGVLLLSINKGVCNSITKKRKIMYIEVLAVKEGYRRKYIGKSLYNEALSLGKEEGVESIELMVWDFNEDARGFYENMGMKIRSTIMEKLLET